jgi:hypothetical protein
MYILFRSFGFIVNLADYVYPVRPFGFIVNLADYVYPV